MGSLTDFSDRSDIFEEPKQEMCSNSDKLVSGNIVVSPESSKHDSERIECFEIQSREESKRPAPILAAKHPNRDADRKISFEAPETFNQGQIFTNI